MRATQNTSRPGTPAAISPPAGAGTREGTTENLDTATSIVATLAANSTIATARGSRHQIAPRSAVTAKWSRFSGVQHHHHQSPTTQTARSLVSAHHSTSWSSTYFSFSEFIFSDFRQNKFMKFRHVIFHKKI
jgi:hypothetical protein